MLPRLPDEIIYLRKNNRSLDLEEKRMRIDERIHFIQ